MRVPRKQSVANIYHVMHRGTGGQLVFEDDEDRLMFLSLCSEVFKEHAVDLYAWCLMGNHFHLLVHAPLEVVSSAMRSLCGQYARFFNKGYGRVGHLYQERFESEPINDDAYLMTVVRYIHQNPDRAGLAGTADYLWSSYHEYLGNLKLCKTDRVLRIFGGIEEFVRFHGIRQSSDGVLDVAEVSCKRKPSGADASIGAANTLIAPLRIETLKGETVQKRNEALCILKDAGFTVRQLERLTGIGRNIIQRAR